MSDINELTAKLKAAALAATPGRIGDRIDGSGSIKYRCVGADGSLVLLTDHKNNEYGFVGENGEADEFFFRLCTPESVLKLIAALEAAEKRVAEFEALIAEQAKRIAELEARTLTVKFPEAATEGGQGYRKKAIWVLREACFDAGINLETGGE
ncbi:hypothetical protein SMZ39_002017 [Cronobacter turicensis]|nr:hypothetical protein [Cronobacter turicensis]ELY4383752.1 hypothetical protein [Cronobacter turicensis]